MEDYRLEQSGQEVQDILNGAAMQVDLTAENDRAELAERTLQGNIDDEASTRENADIELQGHIDDEEIRAKAAEKQNADDIDAIEEKIPSGASSQNKLATVVDLAAKQDVLTFDNAPTPSSTNPVTSGGVYTAIDDEKGARINADAALQQAIEAILLLIPSAASALNQLADKSFVNSTVATASATFRGTYNLVTDLSLAVTATHAQIAAALAGAVSGADNNDYCFVQIPTSADTPTEIRVTERYKFNGEIWAYEYDLNNSGFTAAQWEAINSAITSALVTKLSNLPDATQLATLFAGKQNTLTFDNAPVSGSDNPVKSGGIYDAIAAITAVIPSAATSSNKLVDENALTAYVTGIIGALDASFDLTSADGHVTLKMTQVDGVITTLQILTNDIASAQALTTLSGQVSTNADDIAALQALYNALQQSAPEVIEPTDTWPVANPSTTVIYRVIDRVNTPPQYYSDYMFKDDDLTTPVLMATYNNAIDAVPTAGSHNLVESGGVQNELALGAVYDVSAKNPTAGPNYDGKFESLAALLSDANLNTLIPDAYRKGGMSIKFVQSSDNKYVQYRLMADTFNITPSNWQGVDDKPTSGSDNLVKSGGVFPSSHEVIDVNHSATSAAGTAFKEYYFDVAVGDKIKVTTDEAANWGVYVRISQDGGNTWVKSYDALWGAQTKELEITHNGQLWVTIPAENVTNVTTSIVLENLYYRIGTINASIIEYIDNYGLGVDTIQGGIDELVKRTDCIGHNIFKTTDDSWTIGSADQKIVTVNSTKRYRVRVLSTNPVSYEVGRYNQSWSGTNYNLYTDNDWHEIPMLFDTTRLVLKSTIVASNVTIEVEEIGVEIFNDKLILPKHTYKVRKSGDGDFTSLLEACIEACKYQDSEVFVEEGTYDLIQEFESYYGSDFFTNYTSNSVVGIQLYNRVHLVFATNAVVTFNYEGNNEYVHTRFSPFNSYYDAGGGFKIENLHIRAKNCRYCVHDEKDSTNDSYHHAYINCDMYMDNSANPDWASKQCIGGGLGKDGYIEVVGCSFETVTNNADETAFSWHNCGSSATAKSRLSIRENYVKKGTFTLLWIGTTTAITKAYVSGNSFTAQPKHQSGGGSVENTELISWNNEIRS